ncbi:MAG: PP0621 family protein [Blastocatellia bacterium]
MLKFIFYCILAYLGMRFVRWLIKPSRARSGRVGAQRGATMVRCETCGMFVTQRSALVAGGHDFCSRNCLEQRARRV